jgi:putative ABC transport system permease protein
MKAKQSLPPKLADRLLSWFCKEEILENIQGDLHEVYQKRVDLLGQHRADLLYFFDVLSILRPRLVKRSEGTGQLNQYGIFKNYLKTSVRSIKHNALFSGINVVGLAVSMSVGILMIVLLAELNSFDNFHEKKDRIYRVITSRKSLFQGEAEFFASAPHYIADQIEAQVPGVEQILVLDRDLTADLKIDEKGIAIKGYYATTSFFDVLSFKLKKGNPQTALENPGAIVLTESAAKKLFGDSDPMNKTLAVDNNPDFRIGTITGIVEDPPINSHIDYEALVSMKTMDNSLVEKRRNRRSPGDYAQSYVYLVLKEGTSVDHIEAFMAKMMADHNSRSAPNTLSLQPMEEFVTTDAGLQPGPTFSKQKIDMMIALTLIVLLSACFNYTNLSLVRGLRRSKEICVRKITGANRLQVFSQFMTEAVLLSLLSLIVGTGLFFLIKPEFLSLSNVNTGHRAMFSLDLVPAQSFYFILFAVVVGFIAGFFPALILSKLKASALFNDASKIKIFSGVSTRQVLITGQIALSIGLITCATMAYKQYVYALHYDLGYHTENIVNITVQGDYLDVLENEYAEISSVAETSRSSVILGTRNLMPADAMSEDQSDTIMFSCNYIDSKYLNMHGFKLIAGSNFNSHPTAEDTLNRKIIVNEQFLKALNLGSPHEAIGKHIWYYGEEKLTILGVVSDFVSMSLDAEAPKAFGFLNRSADGNGVLGVKIVGGSLVATMQELEKTYKKVDPIHPFEATFYDDQIAKTYEDSKTTYTIISILAFLAISISALGLLGMAVFTIEMRMKEISIRKVLGAGVTNLMFLLSRSFLVMITIAAAIAIPVSVYIISDFILNKFLYKVERGFIETLSGFLVVLVIGVLTVGWQVRIAAIQNPADLLRDE